jgi:hypothetical protein
LNGTQTSFFDATIPYFGEKLKGFRNEIQTPKDFKNQIESRFGNKFKEAWKESLQIFKAYDSGL